MKQSSARKRGVIGLLAVVVVIGAIAMVAGVSTTGQAPAKSPIAGMSAEDAKALIKLQGGTVKAMAAKGGCRAPGANYPAEAPEAGNGAPASSISQIDSTGDLLKNPADNAPVSVIDAEVLSSKVSSRAIRTGKLVDRQYEARMLMRVCETRQGPAVPKTIVVFQLRADKGALLEGEPAYTRGERYMLFVRPRGGTKAKEYILVSSEGRIFLKKDGTVDPVALDGAAAETVQTLKSPEAVLKVVNADLTLPHEHKGALPSVAQAKKIIKKNNVDSYEEAAALALEESQ
jgi:hypothetical protein